MGSEGAAWGHSAASGMGLPGKCQMQAMETGMWHISEDIWALLALPAAVMLTKKKDFLFQPL